MYLQYLLHPLPSWIKVWELLSLSTQIDWAFVSPVLEWLKGNWCDLPSEITSSNIPCDQVRSPESGKTGRGREKQAVPDLQSSGDGSVPPIRRCWL